MSKIHEDPANRRCDNVSKIYGFHIGDLDFEGYLMVKAADEIHAQSIADTLLISRGLKPYKEYSRASKFASIL